MANNFLPFRDITETDGGDLFISATDGDFTLSQSDKTHISDIILAAPGWWKEYPQLGVGINDYLNASGKEQELVRLIKINLVSDGYTVSMPEAKIQPNGTFKVYPNAVREG